MTPTTRGEMEKRHMARYLGLVGVLLVVWAFPTVAAAQTETVVYFHTDAIGSVRMTTDATGQVIERYDYTPFGEPWPNQTQTEPRRFTGQQLDAETQLQYFGARHYHSQTGRFTRSDDPGYGNPLDPQSMNLYAYALHNPLRYIDPDGHQAISCDSPTSCSTGITVIGTMPSDLDTVAVRWLEYLRWQNFVEGTEDQAGDVVRGVADPVKSPFTPGPRPGCFSENFGFSFQNTNAFFFKGPGKFARTALGAMTGGAMARSTGLTTVGMAARDLIRWQGVANLGVRGTLMSIAANSVLNGGAVVATLEAGITAGSAIDAAYQTFVSRNCK